MSCTFERSSSASPGCGVSACWWSGVFTLRSTDCSGYTQRPVTPVFLLARTPRDKDGALRWSGMFALRSCPTDCSGYAQRPVTPVFLLARTPREKDGALWWSGMFALRSCPTDCSGYTQRPVTPVFLLARTPRDKDGALSTAELRPVGHRGNAASSGCDLIG
ncbi:hypothetical protein C8R45DRAFT_968869 [Mycena sanguinolenta]|nr:hypothetical protein C8R45DRAFT_968869 [Mycena sanguinolenta]